MVLCYAWSQLNVLIIEVTFMTDNLKTYIEQNIDLIDDEKFERLYAGLIEGGLFMFRKELLQLLNDIGVQIKEETVSKVECIFDSMTLDQITSTAESTVPGNYTVTDAIMFILKNWDTYDWGDLYEV